MSRLETLEELRPDMDAIKHPFWRSKRMIYMICAFFCILLHHTLRVAPSTAILCMAKTDKAHGSYEGDLNWSRNEAIWYNSVFNIGYVISLPFFGILSDKYGGKIFFISSLLIESLLFLVTPVCARASYWAAISIRVIAGVAAGMGTPAIYEMFTEWTHPSERTACIAFGYMGFNVGNIVAPILTSKLCLFGWQWVFYGIGTTVFVVAFIMSWLIHSDIEDHPRLSRREYLYLKATKKERSTKLAIPWKKIVKCVPYHIFIITHFLHSFGAFMETHMLPRFFKEAMKTNLGDAGLYTTIVFCGALVSKIAVVIVSFQIEKKKINLDLYRRVLHCVCCFLTVPFFGVSILLTPGQKGFIVAIWTLNVMLTDIAFSAAYWPSLAFLAPSFAGLLIGFANCFGTLSGVLVPVAVTFLTPNASHTEWKGVIGLLIGVNVLEGILFVALGSTKLQPWGLVRSDDGARKQTEENG